VLKVPTSEDGSCIFCISFNWKYYILLTVVTSGLSPMFLPSYSCAAAKYFGVASSEKTDYRYFARYFCFALLNQIS